MLPVREVWAARPAAARAEAAVLLALLAAFALHGLVDDVLGFTGPYLLLAFVVGSACAMRAESGAPGEAA